MKTRNLAIAAVLIVIILGAGIYYYFTLPATVRLLMKDPPVEAYDPSVSHIWITFSSMQMHQIRSGGDSWINLTATNAVTIDLLAILNTTKNLGPFGIPAGNYTEMRFSVSSAKAEITGVNATLTISSGAQTGLKVPIIGKLNLAANQSATITIDISVDSSLVKTLNGMLVPSIKATVT